MTTLSVSSRAIADLRPARAPRVACLLLLAATVAASVAVGHATSAAGAVEPSLLRLLRLMAGLKALMALSGAAAVVWRLGWPASAPLALGYAAAAAAMAATPALIWQMAAVPAAAVLFHGGLLVLLALAYVDRDGGAGAIALLRQRRR